MASLVTRAEAVSARALECAVYCRCRNGHRAHRHGKTPVDCNGRARNSLRCIFNYRAAASPNAVRYRMLPDALLLQALMRTTNRRRAEKLEIHITNDDVPIAGIETNRQFSKRIKTTTTSHQCELHSLTDKSSVRLVCGMDVDK